LDKQKTELDKSLIQIKDNNIILEQRKTELDKSNESLIRTKNDLQTALIIAKSNEKVAVQALEAQWRFTLDATKKSSRINESDVITNILIALEFLPDKSSTNDNRKYFPLIPNVEKALKDALAIVQAVLTGHEDEVDGVAYSPDGKLIATGSDDKTVRIWNAATGDLLQELLGHSNDVCRIAFSPDGNRIVSGSMDGTARIWDVKAGKELHQLKDGSKDRIWGVAWSLDGSHVATGHSRNIRIWNTETGSSPAQLVGHSDSVWDVVFSPDGSRLLSVSSDRTARIWDVNTGTMQLQFNEHDNAVYGASWSSDGKLVATGSADNTVRIWEADTGNQCFSFLHEATVYGVAFSPNGKWLSTGCEDNSARIWDVKTGELKQTLSGHRKGVDAVTWSPDGRLLVTGSDDNTVGVFAFDNTVTRNTASVKMQDLVDRAKKLVPRCFSEEDRAQLGLVNEIPQWCRKMEKPPFDAKGRLERGIWMLTQDPPDFEKAEKLFKEAEKLDSSLADQIQARKVGALREGASKLLAQRVNSIDLVDSKLKTAQEFVKRGIESDLGFTDNFETVKLKFLIDSGQSILLSGRKNDAQQAFRRALSLDPTKRHAVIVARIEAAQKLGQTDIALLLTLELDQDSEDTKRLLSEILRGEATKMLLKGHKEMIFGVAYSPDGKLIGTGSNDKTVRIWDAVTGELRQELRGHSMSVRRIAFSPDSTRIVSGSSDGTARIWDIKNGEELHRLEHQSEDRIWGVAWSGDGIHIASGSLENHHIDIWEAEGSHLKRLVGHSDGVYDVVFSPDGSLLLSVSTDFTSRIWDVNDGTELLLFKQHKDRVYGASWSSDGKLVATGSADNTVRIWEAGTGNQRFVLTHNGYITGISFSPDGRWLATGSQDNSTRIWDTDTGKLKQTLSRSVSRSEGSRLEGTVYAVAWSPDGRLIVTGSGDSTVRIYDTSDLDNVDQSLFDRALSKVTRRLTKEEREEFNLPPEIPEWYNRILRIYTK
ncbi:MAG: WD40 repeat domain-containing protein, partial [Planctomycetes bacterium]|nr:WD40 repeat domain-containing protein [Planctomycetota bacterium]